MSTVSPAIAPPESFAALFEESLQRKEMRIGEVITAEVVRVDHNFVVVNAGLKSEIYHPDRRIPQRSRRGRGEARRLRAGRDRGARGRLRRDAPLARQGEAARGVARPREVAREGHRRAGRHQRQGEGRPHRHDQRHPRLPARLARRHASGQGHHALRGQEDGVQGHQARPQAQQRRRVAPRRARAERRRGARGAARDAAGRRGRQGHRQEHHRLRRVRRPRRHRRPAAHHRPRVAPREASVGSAVGRRRSDGEGAASSTRRRTASRSA